MTTPTVTRARGQHALPHQHDASTSNPTLETALAGRLGLTLCPGKQDRYSQTGPWARDLAAISDWGAGALVTLMEGHELTQLGVGDLGSAARRQGLDWHHLPIPDVSVPDATFAAAWPTASAVLREHLRAGRGVLVHCRGGLGRSGLVVAGLLIELGEAPAAALARVRAVRPGAVETAAQERYVLSWPWQHP